MKSKITTIQEIKDLANDFANTTDNKTNIFENLAEQIKDLNPALGGFDELSLLLSMPNDQFAILAPIFLDELEKSYNNTNDKIMLAQALKASGIKVEDLNAGYMEITEQIDEQLKDSIPQIKRDFLKQMLSLTFNTLADLQGIEKRFITIPIEICHPDAKIPTYANLGDAGMDVYALEDITIAPGETKLIPTGIKVAIPHGYELQVRPKSGRALKTKMRVANTPGTIDSGYRDEIGIIIDNIEPPIKDIGYEFDENGRPIITSILHGQSYTIGKGEKFAQLVLNEVPKVCFFEVQDIGTAGDRGGGFGSSGLK